MFREQSAHVIHADSGDLHDRDTPVAVCRTEDNDDKNLVRKEMTERNNSHYHNAGPVALRFYFNRCLLSEDKSSARLTGSLCAPQPFQMRQVGADCLEHRRIFNVFHSGLPACVLHKTTYLRIVDMTDPGKEMMLNLKIQTT